MIESLAGDAYVQTQNILPTISRALELAGARTEDEVRTAPHNSTKAATLRYATPSVSGLCGRPVTRPVARVGKSPFERCSGRIQAQRRGCYHDHCKMLAIRRVKARLWGTRTISADLCYSGPYSGPPPISY
jgi:hypothetical protein